MIQSNADWSVNRDNFQESSRDEKPSEATDFTSRFTLLSVMAPEMLFPGARGSPKPTLGPQGRVLVGGIGRKAIVIALCLQLVPAFGASLARAAEPPARPVLSGRDLVDVLRRGGYVVYFQHATTDKNQVDADHPDFERCETQRNLSPDGRRLAREIGAAFATLGIPVGRVVSSPYCRSTETATLAFGRREVSRALYFTMGMDREERARQRVGLRRMLSTPPAAGTNTVLVGHNAHLKEATGIWPKVEGDAHVFQPSPDGSFAYVGEVRGEDWARRARGTAAAR